MNTPKPTDKVHRWLDLIAFLVGRRFPVSHEQLMEGVAGYRIDRARGTDPESLRRKFERDKQELRELGIPLESVAYRVDGEDTTGYRLRGRDFYLPYLSLLRQAAPEPPREGGDVYEIEAGELAPAVEGLRALAALPTFPLRREARSAMSKLTFDLDTAHDGPAPAPLLAAADPPSARALVEALTDATTRRKWVRFDYDAPGAGGPQARTVDPWGLLFKFNRWYLVGRDHDRDAMRTFRVARMGGLTVNPRAPGTPDFDRAELDLSSWAARDAWDLPGMDSAARTVDVHFAFPRSLWAERNGKGEPAGAPDRAGGQVRRFQVRNQEPFLRWLLTFEGEATVVAPDDLRAELARLARAVAALYPSAPT